MSEEKGDKTYKWLYETVALRVAKFQPEGMTLESSAKVELQSYPQLCDEGPTNHPLTCCDSKGSSAALESTQEDTRTKPSGWNLRRNLTIQEARAGKSPIFCSLLTVREHLTGMALREGMMSSTHCFRGCSLSQWECCESAK